MMMQSPLKRREVQPNLRKVPQPDLPLSPSSTKSAKPKNNKKVGASKAVFPSLKPSMVILASIIIGVFGFAYLTHVFATQKLLHEVQLMESEYTKARQQYDELKLQYDRLVGPAEIYKKAKEQGFINGGPADNVIEVEK